MRKKLLKNVVIIIEILLFIFSYTVVYAAPIETLETTDTTQANSKNLNITYKGDSEITKDTVNSSGKYSSFIGAENALLVSGGASTLSKITVTKSGDVDTEDADFYGTNAAILAYNSAKLNLNDAVITTNGSHANAVFAYGDGVINISDSNIKTSKNNSGALMVAGGGTITAKDVIATTEGNSSAPIRSDRGGGTLTVNGGTYKSNGVGSPVIYSTANIIANNATLTSTKSEGVVVEGANSVTLNKCTLSDTNTTLNGNSETYKNIFLYQSMSGDAEVGNSSFIAKDSEITTNRGDSIFVTNTTSTISLTNNKIVNNDSTGAFLRIQAGKWGKKNENGGIVTLNAAKQTMNGDVVVDNISSLAFNITSGSNYKGAINSDNKAKTIALKLDGSSTLTLTEDSYITSLDNSVKDNGNINLNGHKLYVNGTAIADTKYVGATEEPKVEENVVNTTTANTIANNISNTVAGENKTNTTNTTNSTNTTNTISKDTVATTKTNNTESSNSSSGKITVFVFLVLIVALVIIIVMSFKGNKDR